MIDERTEERAAEAGAAAPAAEEEGRAGASSPDGVPNPHHRPRPVAWHTVEVVCGYGAEAFVVSTEGRLRVILRPPAGRWPAWFDPEPCIRHGAHYILDHGKDTFEVMAAERGPAVGHAFREDPAAPDVCLDCGLGERVDCEYLPPAAHGGG